MDITAAFPSKHLKVADLGGKPVRLKIASVNEGEKIGDDIKPVISFEGTSKTLVLNITNANLIVLALKTKETNDWPGQVIELYPDMTQYQGRLVDCIRVRAPTSRPAPQQQTAPARPEPPPASETDYGALLDDEIPF